MISPRIAVVISQFNKEISDKLLEGALDAYKQVYGNTDNVDIFNVPGAFEIPGFVSEIITIKSSYHAFVTLGSVIKGETAHFEYISSSVTQSISTISLNSHIPIIYGILTTYNYQQAFDRADIKKLNKGGEVMSAALQAIETYNKIQ